MDDRRGFTLIEILIVIAIVGIMAVVATTNFQLWLSHNSAIGFQREFLAQINQARTRSMASNLQHRLLMDLDAETVTLQRGNLGTGTLPSGWTTTISTISGSKGAGVNEVIFTPAVTVPTSFALVFNPNGQVLAQDNTSSSAATPLTQANIRLSSDSTADHATILLYGWTSKARLVNGWL